MKSKKSIIAVLSFMLIVSIAGFSISTIHKDFTAKAYAKTEENLKNEIIKFSGKSSTNIKKTSEMLKNNTQVYEFTDDEFLYDVGESGNIRTIVRKNVDKLGKGMKIDKKDVESKAKDVLKKLNNSMKDYKLTITDGAKSNGVAYTVKFEDKINADTYTGSFVIIDLSEDGQVLNVVNKKVVTPINFQGPKISKQEAKKIMDEYFRNHKTISKYTNQLSDDNYKIFQTVANGAQVWRCEVKLPEDVVKGCTLLYLIDANTGNIILSDEPKLVGF